MDESYKPSWKNRRKVIFVTLLFCGASVAYMMIADTGSSLHEALTGQLVLLAGSVIASYVFGAAWQDVSLGKKQ